MGFQLSTCPYCSSGCGLLLHTEQGRLVESHPSAAHPISQGSLCIRGWNCSDAPSHGDRLTTPLVRSGDAFTRVSWERAVEEIALRLKADAGGVPALFAVGPTLANEDVYAVRRLARSLGARTGSTDLGGVSAARRAFLNVLGRGYALRDLNALAEADVIWSFGADLDDCPQVTSRLVQAARNGAGIVQFDVYGASTFGSHAQAVSIPPDRFEIVPLLLQQVIFGLDSVPARAKATAGFANLSLYWTAWPTPTLPDHPWLTDDRARQLVDSFLGARRPAAIIGSRWLSSVNGEQQTRQLLQALTLLGAEERVLAPAGEANSWGVLDVLQEDEQESSALVDLLDPGHPGLPSALFVVGDNLIRRTSRPEALADKLAQIDTVVVIDRFESETSKFAHVVLPSCAFGELDGTLTNACGTVQRWRQVVAPLADSCPERLWMARIGSRLGVDGWPETPEAWFAALQEETPLYRSPLFQQLYNGEPPFGVAVEEPTRLTFTAPVVTPPSSDPGAFPMRMLFGAHPANWSTGALSQREDLLKREVIESSVAVSPGDLKQLGVKPGWTIKVVTSDGEATLPAREDSRLPPGVVVVIPLAGSEPTRLRGLYTDTARRHVAIQPVPARLEKV
jgi:predicted molibdopterin-dependent oxidoreductase YjgC